MLTQLVALEHVLDSGLEIASLAFELAQADVHVRGASQNRRRVRGRKLQRLLIGAPGVVQSTLGDA